jgi:SAM-dependent methyltransferase
VNDVVETRATPEAIASKFDGLAPGYGEHDYADPARYHSRRAQLAVRLGPQLPPGASVLDLGCGDAGMADPLLDFGYRYHGVDASTGMLREVYRRLGPNADVEAADLESYRPIGTVDLVLALRAVCYARDREAFFRRVAGYAGTKFVFDFNPRAQDRRAIEADLAAAGFSNVIFHPFFLPQRVSVPAPVRLSLRGLEHVPVLAALALRVRGIWFCAAWR